MWAYFLHVHTNTVFVQILVPTNEFVQNTDVKCVGNIAYESLMETQMIIIIYGQ